MKRCLFTVTTAVTIWAVPGAPPVNAAPTVHMTAGVPTEQKPGVHMTLGPI